MKRVPWFRKLKKTHPDVPLRMPLECDAVSNGEGWWPDTPRKKLIRKLTFDIAEQKARKHNVDRREFLSSACGMATSLYVINMVNGCASESGGGNQDPFGPGVMAPNGTGPGAGMLPPASGAGVGGNMTGMDGAGTGGFKVDAGAMDDPGMAETCLGMGGQELIVDMQSHFANEASNPIGAQLLQGFIGSIDHEWVERTPGCDGVCRYSRQEYIDQLLMGSDTTVGVLSGISYELGGFAVLNNEDLFAGADHFRNMFPGRILTHAMVMPNDRLQLQLDTMEANADKANNWKTYPPWSPDMNGGYWLDDPAVAGPMFQKGLDLNRPIFCVHKGFPLSGFSPTYTNPKDVGPAARMFPDVRLVIYHSAFEHGLASGESSRTGIWPEGPYDEDDPAVQVMYPLDRGVNSLIKSLRDSNIGPNGTNLDGSPGESHVYAECGGAWPNLMVGRVEEAMHYWGKLLKHLGEDRIVWGTDCLWFGSPRPVIEAFRAFEISQAFQDLYGYPALTPAIKEKILGQNAARLQSILHDVDLSGCDGDFRMALNRQRRDMDEQLGARRYMMKHTAAPRTRREFLALREAEHQEKLRASGVTMWGHSLSKQRRKSEGRAT